MTSALPINGVMIPANNQSPQSGQVTDGGVLAHDRNKEWQLELLMEKLRSKASTYKTLPETAKSIRMTMLDKRFAIDSVEKNQLQKCLDALQHSIKVASLQSMIERLESLSRQLGLKFMMSGPQGTELFISSDMFFLEICLETSGAVKDVKIHHEGKTEQQSCEELVTCLSKGDFVDFTTQLEGLASIYQLNADKKVKCKAFSALQSLETDLGILAQVQTFIKEPFNLVHKSPVGILERRKGGHAMKLTYFVSPYDLINLENKSCEGLSLDAVISKKVGHSVTVCMEGSTAHKLPTSSIITVNRSSTGKNTPSYAPLISTNSSMLPACFILKLAKKMPMCLELIRRVQKVTELECTDVSAPSPLLSMIVRHASEQKLDCQNNRGLYVTLPDQQHCYFMTENKNMEGVLVGSIPFTHPAHVPQILVYLRQQALFNTLISSCVRSMAKQDIENATMFEISALSWQCISVSLEHPFEETMATAELDLTDISAIKCKLYGVNMTNTEQSSELGGKVLQSCLSIPITMRTLIKAWQGRTSLINSMTSGTNGHFNNINLMNTDINNQNGKGGPEFKTEDIKIKQEPGINGTGRQQLQNQQQQSFLDAGAENSIGFPAYSGQSDTSSNSTNILSTIQLGNLLGQTKNLSNLSTSPTNTLNDNKNKKNRKRKSADNSSWKSSKHKSDQESSEILLDSSSSDSMPTDPLAGIKDNMDNRTPTPTSAASVTSGGLDLSTYDPLEILSTDKSSDYDIENETEIMEIEPCIEDIIKLERKPKKQKSDDKKSPTTIFEENKSLIPPSVSITPIPSSSSNQSSSSSTNYNSMLTSMGLEKRPGIEIIPFGSGPQTSLPSSITITAINPVSKSTVDDRKDRKSSKNRLNAIEESKSKADKKKKRKREDSPMGPPDNYPLKSDPMLKPISVTIKPSESPPSSPATTLRKFSPSPTHTNPLLMGKTSPTLKQSSSKSMTSPKHSPVYNSSPKHIPVMQSSVSPKHGISSPKHGNSVSTGKPSMSALKSAANSPSHKSNDAVTITPKNKITSPSSSTSALSSSSAILSALPSVTLTPTSSLSATSLGKESSSRDKDRKSSSMFSSSSGHLSPKSKISSSKPKVVDSDIILQASISSSSSGGSTTPPTDYSKSASVVAPKKGRGSLISAVIDKLKNAQHCTDDGSNGAPKPLVLSPNPSGASSSSKDRALSSASKILPDNKNSSSKPQQGDAKNPTEYMVKPNSSSDGIKITINKTRSKDSKSSNNSKVSPSTSSSSVTSGAGSIIAGSNPGNVSPKTYTGLKPGVISGPASKKPQTQISQKNRSASPLITGTSGSSKTSSGQKISSSSVKSGSGITSISSGFLGKNSSGAKSLSSSTSSSSLSKQSSSGAADLSRAREKSRLKSNEKGIFSSKSSDFSALSGLPPQLMVEGRMKLDTNFQIPKLSARVNADNADKRSIDKVDFPSKSASEKSDSLSRLASIKSEENTGTNQSSNLNISSNKESDLPTNLSKQSEESLTNLSTSSKHSYPGEGSSNLESLNLSTKSSEKFKALDDKEQLQQSFHRSSPNILPSSSTATTSQEAAEMLLDFSTSKELLKKMTPPSPPPPPPPLPPPLMSSQTLTSSIAAAAAVPLTAVLASIPSSVSPISSYPSSPSVSLHIVKSPAPSPRVIPPSPHSASPCITDDELMDEALVGS